MAKTAVIGGQDIDFCRPNTPLVAKDSNPGKVRVSEGGVARNIAFNLSLLGALAVPHMEIHEKITPAFLLRKMPAINEASSVRI